ncbi:putative Zinc metallopeptidase signature protein (plasmid) [Paenarthrobacter aurescens TC1]|nr:putative Zinc metallopeptidase signature protein [Paenarthrobacter aurescens TC1]
MTGSGNRCFGRPMPRRHRGFIPAQRSLVSVALALGLVLTACTPSSTPGDPHNGFEQGTSGTFVPDREESLGESLRDSPPECSAPAAADMEDIDPEDSPVKPWQNTTETELAVEFETGRLSERHSGLVSEAATIWSKSPCLNAVAVQICSGGANCVAMVEDDSRSGGTDGEMRWEGTGAYMDSATITLYTQPLDRATDNGALATIVHEMGHTLGLAHRVERYDVMNSVTGNDTNPVPDAIDFSNLVAIYGA